MDGPILRRRVRSAVLVLYALGSASGCSYVFVTEAPANHGRLQYFDCTSSRVAPVLDTIGTGVLALSAGTYVVDPDSSDESGEIAARVGVTLALAALAGVSAVYGYGHTAECGAAKQALALRSAEKTAPAAVPGCGADADCKGDRICVAHQCVDPPPAPATTPIPGSVPGPGPVPGSGSGSGSGSGPGSGPGPAPTPTYAPSP